MNYKSIELNYGRNIISTAQEPKDLQDKLKDVANSFELNNPNSHNDFGFVWTWEKELVRCDLRIIRNVSCYAIQVFLTKKNGLEQVPLLKVQPELPRDKIKEVGRKAKENGTADIFKPGQEENPENLNLF